MTKTTTPRQRIVTGVLLAMAGLACVLAAVILVLLFTGKLGRPQLPAEAPDPGAMPPHPVDARPDGS